MITLEPRTRRHAQKKGWPTPSTLSITKACSKIRALFSEGAVDPKLGSLTLRNVTRRLLSNNLYAYTGSTLAPKGHNYFHISNISSFTKIVLA